TRARLRGRCLRHRRHVHPRRHLPLRGLRRRRHPRVLGPRLQILAQDGPSPHTPGIRTRTRIHDRTERWRRLPRPDAAIRLRRLTDQQGRGLTMATLQITDLHVSVTTDQGDRPILNGVTLSISSGETHAIMGPNGSGKSTLAYTIAGHPKYTVTSGTITLDGADVLAMSVDERARAGLFLAMQYPVEIPGVTVTNFLRTAKTAIAGEAPAIRQWGKDVKQSMEALRMDPSFAARNVNEGFSGGEKKRHEIVQLELLKPRFAVLDETDSGL